MKYYNIGHVNELEIIGFYPQTERLQGYHVDTLNSVNNVSCDFFPDFEPEYGLVLNNNSIATDVLDRGTLDFGLVVSGRLKSILETFKLPPNRFYHIDVLGTDKNYFWFHYITNFEEYMDFEKTEIEIYDRITSNVSEVVKFNSFGQVMQCKKNLVMQRGLSMRYRIVQLRYNFPDYDLFEVTGAQNITLISERLRNELLRENVTGLNIVKFDKVIR